MKKIVGVAKYLILLGSMAGKFKYTPGQDVLKIWIANLLLIKTVDAFKDTKGFV